jgi:hypothetical protein
LVAPAGGVDRAEEFAEPEGRALPRAAADGLAVAEVAVVEAAELRFCALRVAVAEGWLWWSCPVAGLNVATDSMAPATRQTARMLASSGITVPCPENGAASRRSRRRRRRARSSRW